MVLTKISHMLSKEFHPSDCCVKCPYYDEFGQTCTHNLSQVIIHEMADKNRSTCPVFSRIRAQSMQELERQVSP